MNTSLGSLAYTHNKFTGINISHVKECKLRKSVNINTYRCQVHKSANPSMEN